jgi:hypothetical protein
MFSRYQFIKTFLKLNDGLCVCVSVCMWASELVSEWVCVCVCVCIWASEWVCKWMSRWVNEWVGDWVNEWVGEQVGELVNKWVSGWMNEWVSVCVCVCVCVRACVWVCVGSPWFYVMNFLQWVKLKKKIISPDARLLISLKYCRTVQYVSTSHSMFSRYVLISGIRPTKSSWNHQGQYNLP